MGGTHFAKLRQNGKQTKAMFSGGIDNTMGVRNMLSTIDLVFVIGIPVIAVFFGILTLIKTLSFKDFGFWTITAIIILTMIVSLISPVNDWGFIGMLVKFVILAFAIGRILHWFEVRTQASK